nr:MAG TPA: hypothetical protein [Caudoviricetes sp.]
MNKLIQILYVIVVIKTAMTVDILILVQKNSGEWLLPTMIAEVLDTIKLSLIQK